MLSKNFQFQMYSSLQRFAVINIIPVCDKKNALPHVTARSWPRCRQPPAPLTRPLKAAAAAVRHAYPRNCPGSTCCSARRRQTAVNETPCAHTGSPRLHRHPVRAPWSPRFADSKAAPRLTDTSNHPRRAGSAECSTVDLQSRELLVQLRSSQARRRWCSYSRPSAAPRWCSSATSRLSLPSMTTSPSSWCS